MKLIFPVFSGNSGGDGLHAEDKGDAAKPASVFPKDAGEDGTCKTAEIIERNIETGSGGAGFTGGFADLAGGGGLAAEGARGTKRQAGDDKGDELDKRQEHAADGDEDSHDHSPAITDAIKETASEWRNNRADQINRKDGSKGGGTEVERLIRQVKIDVSKRPDQGEENVEGHGISSKKLRIT